MYFNMSLNNTNNSVTNHTSDNERETQKIISAGFGIAGLCFITLGIIANVFAVVVLLQKAMRCLGTKLLVSLAFVDILLLTLNSFRAAKDLHVGKLAKGVLTELSNVTYPLFMTVYMIEIYLTSLITVQRYVSVAKPLEAKSLMNERRLVIIMAILGSWCIVFNIPQWIVFQPVFYYNTDLQITWIRHATYIMPDKGFFYKSTFYEIVYVGYLSFIFRFLIPMAAMFVFNILIVRIVKQHTLFRQSLQIGNQSEKSDSRLTITIIAITTSSLIATFLDALDLLLFAFLNWEAKCSQACYIFWHVSDLMIIVNCSFNCIFYCIFGGKFRQICLGLFCRFTSRNIENGSSQMTETFCLREPHASMLVRRNGSRENDGTPI